MNTFNQSKKKTTWRKRVKQKLASNFPRSRPIEINFLTSDFYLLPGNLLKILSFKEDLKTPSWKLIFWRINHFKAAISRISRRLIVNIIIIWISKNYIHKYHITPETGFLYFNQCYIFWEWYDSYEGHFLVCWKLMIMYTIGRRPILDIAALKWTMRQKLNFQDGVFRSPFRKRTLLFYCGFFYFFLFEVWS